MKYRIIRRMNENFIFQSFKEVKNKNTIEEKVRDTLEFSIINEGKKYAEDNIPEYVNIDWIILSEDEIIGTENILCFYCNNWKPRPDGEGEHPIPMALGAKRTKTDRICKDCNDMAATILDSPIVNSELFKLLRSTLSIKGRNDPPYVRFPFEFIHDNEKFELLIDIEGQNIKIKPKHYRVDIKDIPIQYLDIKKSFAVDEMLIKREIAKIILGLTSMNVDGFRDSTIAQDLYFFAFKGITSGNLLLDFEKQDNFKILTQGDCLILPQNKDWAHDYSIVNLKPKNCYLISFILIGMFRLSLKIPNNSPVFNLLKKIDKDFFLSINPLNTGKSEVYF